MEKQFYSKLCVAESIKFVVDEARRNDTSLQKNERFSCNLATILARDKEVVAVRLKTSMNSCIVYISKNGDWKRSDEDYVKRIERYLRSISEDAPMTLTNALNRDDVRDLFNDVMSYCSAKLESRFNKLKQDIINNQDEEYIKSFISFMGRSSINVDGLECVQRHVMSRVCCNYYKKLKTTKNSPATLERFIRHLKKVGSYIGSLVNITKCACNEFHRDQIFNLKLIVLQPDKAFHFVFSWNSIVQKYFNFKNGIPKGFKEYRNECLKNKKINKRLTDIYGEPLDTQLDMEIKQDVCLHPEMNILADIINKNDKSRVFIATSKNCCYLCELYVKFARDRGYDVVISGSQEKIYRAWKLPEIKNPTFWRNSLSYLLTDIDQIIGNEIKKHSISLALYDSEENNLESVSLNEEVNDGIDA